LIDKETKKYEVIETVENLINKEMASYVNWKTFFDLDLTEDEFLKYYQYVPSWSDFNYKASYFTERVFYEVEDFVKWFKFNNPTYSIEFYKKYSKRINFLAMSYNDLSVEFMKAFKTRLDWSILSQFFNKDHVGHLTSLTNYVKWDILLTRPEVIISDDLFKKIIKKLKKTRYLTKDILFNICRFRKISEGLLKFMFTVPDFNFLAAIKYKAISLSTLEKNLGKILNCSNMILDSNVYNAYGDFDIFKNYYEEIDHDWCLRNLSFFVINADNHKYTRELLGGMLGCKGSDKLYRTYIKYCSDYRKKVKWRFINFGSVSADLLRELKPRIDIMDKKAQETYELMYDISMNFKFNSKTIEEFKDIIVWEASIHNSTIRKMVLVNNLEKIRLEAINTLIDNYGRHNYGISYNRMKIIKEIKALKEISIG